MTYEPVTVENLLVHQDWALRLARRLVREDGEAEDLVQRTWMAALRRPPDTERGARAWIRKVILNLARERHRRGKTREGYEHAFPSTEVDAPDMLDALSRDEIRKTLSERLLELDEPYRSVVLQRYYDGLSSVEIARRLGIPAGTVRWRLKVGLDQLRADLDRRSHGDRSRWVSALMLLLPPGTDVTADVDPDEPAPEPRPTPVLRPALLGPTGWVAVTGASVLGLVLLNRGLERPASETGTVQAALSTALPADETVDAGRRAAAAVERSPLVIAPAPSAGEAPAATGLRLVVVDREGNPVPAAQILVASASGFEERTTADAEGRASLQVRDEDQGALGLTATRGRVSVRALAPGREASPLVHVAAPFTPEHEVRLVVGGPELRLTGRVVDRKGRPIAGAVLAWFDAEKRLERVQEGDFASPTYISARSDGEGRYVLAHLSGSRGTLGCFAQGFAYAALVQESPSQEPVEFVLERGARVSGVVRWPDGRPAAGINVGCEPLLKAAEWSTGLPTYDATWRGFGESTKTDELGRFTLEGVKADRQRNLWARDERTGLVASETRVLQNEAEEHWDAELAERAGFRLRLVDEAHHPLPGWVVHLRRPLEGASWWIRRRAADEEGRLLVTDCSDDEVFLDVFSPEDVGASYTWRRLRPSPDEVVVVVETRATSSISGSVLDLLGQPELRGRLQIHALRTTLATPVERDAQGGFEQRLAPGTYGLALEVDRTAALLKHIVLKPGENLALGALTPPPLGLLRLNSSALQRTSGVPSYSLFALSEDQRDHTFLHASRGVLEGELLMPMFAGRYRLLVFDGSGEKPTKHEFKVDAHAETRLDLGR